MLEPIEGELIGLEAIAKEWDPKLPTRHAQALIFTGVIPARKIGLCWVSSAAAIARAKAARIGVEEEHTE